MAQAEQVKQVDPAKKAAAQKEIRKALDEGAPIAVERLNELRKDLGKDPIKVPPAEKEAPTKDAKG